METGHLKETLDALYARFNTPGAIHPDPLEFVRRYPDERDREVVALIASSLAYGRVQGILKNVSAVLDPLRSSPSKFIISHDIDDFKTLYGTFVHRFTRGGEIALLLTAMKRILAAHGSLKACFLSHYRDDMPNILPVLQGFVHEIHHAAGHPFRSLLPDPGKGSALKRLNLFLRWMVRRDRVDPGGWGEISPSKLIYPLDTHIYAVGLRLRLTRRKGADLKTALEITDGFRSFSPDDPVRYDFALSRIGILKLDQRTPPGFLDFSGKDS